MYNRAICTFFMSLKECEMSFNHGTWAVVKFSAGVYYKTSEEGKLSVVSPLCGNWENGRAGNKTSISSHPTRWVFSCINDASSVIRVQKLFGGHVDGWISRSMGKWINGHMNKKLKPSPVCQESKKVKENTPFKYFRNKELKSQTDHT